jgi:hypothetical protein
VTRLNKLMFGSMVILSRSTAANSYVSFDVFFDVIFIQESYT